MVIVRGVVRQHLIHIDAVLGCHNDVVFAASKRVNHLAFVRHVVEHRRHCHRVQIEHEYAFALRTYDKLILLGSNDAANRHSFKKLCITWQNEFLLVFQALVNIIQPVVEEAEPDALLCIAGHCRNVEMIQERIVCQFFLCRVVKE